MSAIEAVPQPAPGWTQGSCYCGCGYPIPKSRPDKPNPRMFYSRAHRSTRAPDGRLVTEFTTKWCNTCAQRLPHEAFPTKTVRRKAGYVQRMGFYCHDCMKIHLEEIGRRPNVKENARIRSREAYANPALRARQLQANRDRYWAKKADPEQHEIMRTKSRHQRREYLKRIQQDPERWAKFQQAQIDRYARQKEQRQLRRLEELDPLVLDAGDPMRDWLYQQCLAYASVRNMSLKELFPDFDISKWKMNSKASGSRYMRFSLVDEILVRLDLQHRLDDFTFYRRSVLSRQRRLNSAAKKHDDQDDHDDQNHGADANIHAISIPPAG